MKKSFFKRAVATVAAVPLALTQCLTCSFAETTVDTASQADAAVAAAAGDSVYTLESLLRIEPDQKYSEWNSNAETALVGLSAIGKTTGTINTENFIALAAANAGKYGALVENVLGQVKNVQYRITNKNDIIITADIDNISEALNKDFPLSLGSAVRMLVDGTGAEGLYEIDYTTIDASGKVEIVINSSALAEGTKVPATFTFTPNGGKALDLMGSVAYANQTIEEYRAIAYAKIDELAEVEDKDGAKEQIDKSFDLYLGRIQAAVDNYMKLVDMNKSKKYDNISGFIGSINRRLEIAGIQRKLPATGAGIAANPIVSGVFDIVKGMVNNAAAGAASFDITLAELGAFADELTNIEATANGGVYTLSAQFADDEAAEVAEYYNNSPDEGQYVNSYKIITGSVALGGENYVDLKIERVVNTTDKTTTTTTTTTTTEANPDDTTTTTTEANPDDTTTTTTEANPDDTTTTTTEANPDDTTTTTTEANPDDTTTTTTTTTTSSGDIDDTTTTTTTSTTTTTPPHSTTTTTVTGVVKELAKTYAEVDSEYGFYFSYEEEFNTAQLGDAKLIKLYDNVAVDEDGNYVLDEEGNKIVVSSESVEEDITGLVDFGIASPAKTFDESNLTFRYDIPLSYFGEDLVDMDGNAITAEAYIGKKGDVTLDNILSASDASSMLIAYTKISAGTGAVDPDTILFTRETMTTDPAGVLDQFAAFLGDVDCNITDNWKAKKNERAIIGADASYILRAATLLGASFEGTEKELWAEVMAE